MKEFEKWLREVAGPGERNNKVAREALAEIERLRSKVNALLGVIDANANNFKAAIVAYGQEPLPNNQTKENGE